MLGDIRVLGVERSVHLAVDGGYSRLDPDEAAAVAQELLLVVGVTDPGLALRVAGMVAGEVAGERAA